MGCGRGSVRSALTRYSASEVFTYFPVPRYKCVHGHVRQRSCTGPGLSIRMSHLREEEAHGQRCRARAWPLVVYGPLQSRGRRGGGRRMSICTGGLENRARWPRDAVARTTAGPGGLHSKCPYRDLPLVKAVHSAALRNLVTARFSFRDFAGAAKYMWISNEVCRGEGKNRLRRIGDAEIRHPFCSCSCV